MPVTFQAGYYQIKNARTNDYVIDRQANGMSLVELSPSNALVSYVLFTNVLGELISVDRY